MTNKYQSGRSYKKLSIKDIVKRVRQDNLATQAELNCSRDDLQFAHIVIDSESFVENFTKDGNKYLCARLRPGFIGNKVTVDGGINYIQAERGKPFGSVVAIPNSKGTVTIGLSYTENEPTNNPYPVVGLATALKHAIESRDKGIELYIPDEVKSEAICQVEYFTKRALAYFNPEVYSYSRGQNDKKVIYENYEEIHSRREQILGSEKLKAAKPKSKKN